MVREKVKANAAWFVYSVQELIDELDKGKSTENLKMVAGGSGEAFSGVHFGYKAAEGVEVPLSPTALTAAN